jgi:ribose 5-phosphate isomerase B
MKLYLGSDHAGFFLKQKIKFFLNKKNIPYEDLGDFQKNTEDDYPDFILPVAKKVSREKNARGIIIGGTGQGEAMIANKIKGIRAAVYYGGSRKLVTLSRTHNNANILSLGVRFLTEKQALSALKIWLKTPFSNASRHARRIKKINKLGR